MAEILDIVQRLTYQVENTELQRGVAELQKQIQAVVNYGTRVSNLEKALAATAQADIQRRQRLTALINQNRAAVDAQNTSIQRTISNNRALQDGLAREIGLINTLNMRINTLREARNNAGTAGEIRNINRELGVLEGNLSRLQGSGRGGGILSQLGGGLLQGLGLAGGLGIASAVGQVKDFVEESGQLAKEAEGVNRAFQNLNQPDLLDNLRKATKGTVSDLDLMKQAIQFTNFGLPIDKLATALEFARRRAKDTGESIEYITNSLVTGIARQSPRILDNLGINAKRVSDEFKTMGDFSAAAFKIIQEESAKATEDLESFAETQARFNAQIENQQVKLGESYNKARGFIYALINDFTNPYDLGKNTKEYIDLQGKITDAKQNQIYANIIADKQYLQSFQQFTTNYSKADLLGRDKIKEQAADAYKTLSDYANEHYKGQARNLTTHLLGLREAYQRFTTTIRNSPLDLNTLTPSGIKGLSAGQLNDLNEQIALQSNNLTRGDKGTISAFRSLSAAIDEELKRLDTGTQSTKAADSAAEKYKKTLEQLKIAILDVSKSFRDIDKEFEAEAKRLDDNAAKGSKVYNDFFTGFGNNFNGNDPESNKRAEQLRFTLEETQRKNAEARKKKTGVTDPEDVKAARQKSNIDALKSSYESLAGVLQTINGLYAQQQQLLDIQFNNQQERVRQAELLAERGNVAELKSEQEKLNKIAKAREDNAQKQLQLNALLAASEAAVGLAKSISAIANAGLGDPYTAAARILAVAAALAASFASIRALSAQGFAEGGYTGDGAKYDPAGTVHRGEFVMTAERTKQFRPLLESIHKGEMPAMVPLNSTNSINTQRMEKELAAIRDALENSQINVKQSMNGSGLHQLVERTTRAERKRLK